jgi:APA family basic amino acid/polyamine antiporter
MQPFDEINAVEGIPGAFHSRNADFVVNMATLGAIVKLLLVIVTAVMAQPRLQYALASDGLIPELFCQVDETDTLWKGTAFAGVVMTLIESKHLNGIISAGVLVAFSMTNSSLILLKHESPGKTPLLLEGCPHPLTVSPFWQACSCRLPFLRQSLARH